MRDAAEAGLLARCRQGDAEAWDELFDLHYAAAGRFVFQLSPRFSREDVEEICQEAFLTVIRSLDSFQGGSAFQTWLFRIAANKAHDYRERQNAAKRGGGQVTVSLHQQSGEEEFVIDPPSPLPGPDLVLLNAEQNYLVGEALEQLGGPCQEIIELRYFADLSYEEIAASLELNPKTVSSRLSKCLDKLEAVTRTLLARADPSGPGALNGARVPPEALATRGDTAASSEADHRRSAPVPGRGKPHSSTTVAAAEDGRTSPARESGSPLARENKSTTSV